MPSPSESILNYLRAKDGNRPYWMRCAFAESALLKMVVKTEAISFPPFSEGLRSITEVLIRQFAQSFENVFTFCLSDPPKDDAERFSCPWIAGMSEKHSGAVRVGCGRYDWIFQTRDASFLVQELTITIENMQIFPRSDLGAIMDWLSSLPYPWCPVRTAVGSAPKVEGLGAILEYVSHGPV